MAAKGSTLCTRMSGLIIAQRRELTFMTTRRDGSASTGDLHNWNDFSCLLPFGLVWCSCCSVSRRASSLQISSEIIIWPPGHLGSRIFLAQHLCYSCIITAILLKGRLQQPYVHIVFNIRCTPLWQQSVMMLCANQPTTSVATVHSFSCKQENWRLTAVDE